MTKNNLNITLTKKDERLLHHALRLNVGVVKNLIAIYNSIHANKSPDFDAIEILLDEMLLDIVHINNIRRYVYTQNFDKKSLIMVYFKNTETFDNWLIERKAHLLQVRQKIFSKNTTWEYSEANLIYNVTNWMDDSTIQMAKSLNYDLETV